ncbi:MAG: EamA/RhaT family transporter, partial [Acidobacteriota bacterium]|nr:EamA/RhaT family transporter [Acidobacteriota bacterium]
LMAAGAAAIAFSSATGAEHVRWHDAAQRESERYGTDPKYVQAGLEGADSVGSQQRRTWVDWVLVSLATAVFITFALVSRAPNLALNWSAAAVLSLAMLVLLVICGSALWKTTRFS